LLPHSEIVPRTEYHCKRDFNDAVALVFKPGKG
jgi:hypothetical protein